MLDLRDNGERESSMQLGSREFQRSTTAFARSLALTITASVSNCDLVFQQAVLEKVVGHALLKDCTPTYLQDVAVIKSNHAIVQSFKRGLEDHLTGRRPKTRTLAKDIVCTLATSDLNMSNREVARTLGVDRRNITKSIERRLQLDASGTLFWTSRRRAVRVDSMPSELKALVVQWWTSDTSISPNRKDISRRRVGVNEFEEHPKHYLQISQVWSHGTTLSFVSLFMW